MKLKGELRRSWLLHFIFLLEIFTKIPQLTEGGRRGSGKGPINDVNSFHHQNLVTPLDFINNQTIGEFVYTEKEKNMRRSKFWPLFAIVKYRTEICMTSTEEYGVCYSRAECAFAGGTSLGTCASGLGICCKLVADCGDIIFHNGTSFQNPGYPQKYSPPEGSNICQVRIRRNFKLNVCQVRLNFVQFEIDGPIVPPQNPQGGAASVVDAGSCKTDSLAITTTGGTVPSLCGRMTGQHVYADFGSSDTITLNLILSGKVQRERQWNIEIVMIGCRAELRAPPGCLQFFTGISGTVQSFNFQGGYHLANQDYSVCIRPEDGMRFIDWSPCNPGDVRISGGVTTGILLPQICPQNVGGQASSVDYLTISGGVNYPLLAQTQTTPLTVTSSISDRFCDVSFPAAVTNAYVRSDNRPFILHFSTDSTEIANPGGTGTQEASVGFCLRWQQNAA